VHVLANAINVDPIDSVLGSGDLLVVSRPDFSIFYELVYFSSAQTEHCHHGSDVSEFRLGSSPLIVDLVRHAIKLLTLLSGRNLFIALVL
jgi:hypothetical protein